MEAAGVIEGYAAILSEKALGRSATIFVAVTLENQRSETMAKFERAVAKCREVQDCHLMTGESDYLLRIVIADDDRYERIHQETFSRLPGVRRLVSNFTIRTVFRRAARSRTEDRKANGREGAAIRRLAQKTQVGRTQMFWPLAASRSRRRSGSERAARTWLASCLARVRQPTWRRRRAGGGRCGLRSAGRRRRRARVLCDVVVDGGALARLASSPSCFATSRRGVGWRRGLRQANRCGDTGGRGHDEYAVHGISSGAARPVAG